MSDAPITREALSDMCDRLIRNSILLRTIRLAEGETIPVGATKFGGMPDVPEGFQWPVEVLPGIPGERPPGRWAKTFVFQVNCAQVAVYDEDKVLPPRGMFYFFYDDENYAPEVVFAAEDEPLAPGTFPEGAQLPEKMPAHKVVFELEKQLPDYGDLAGFPGFPAIDRDMYEEIVKEKGCRTWGEVLKENRITHRLLGYPDLIQTSVAGSAERERLSIPSTPEPPKEYLSEMIWQRLRRTFCGKPKPQPEPVPTKAELDAAVEAFSRWIFLFQLDSTVAKKDEKTVDYSLSIGDCGRVYYYIREDALRERDFSRIYMEPQCF